MFYIENHTYYKTKSWHNVLERAKYIVNSGKASEARIIKSTRNYGKQNAAIVRKGTIELVLLGKVTTYTYNKREASARVEALEAWNRERERVSKMLAQ